MLFVKIGVAVLKVTEAGPNICPSLKKKMYYCSVSVLFSPCVPVILTFFDCMILYFSDDALCKKWSLQMSFTVTYKLPQGFMFSFNLFQVSRT